MLSSDIQDSLRQYFQLLEGPVVLSASLGADEHSGQMREFLRQIAALSPLLVLREESLERTPSFRIGERVTFAAIPLGHELNSFVLALLQASGRKPKVSDALLEQIKSISTRHDFTAYVSLSCHNCPDVVQALNLLSVLNPNIRSTTVDGALFEEEVRSKDILAVPYVLDGQEFFLSGRTTLEEVVSQLSDGSQEPSDSDTLFDVLVLGGGPAGASAAIYAARKGIKTALVAERFGGQVSDTLGIENLAGTAYIEGPTLVKQLHDHVSGYGVHLFLGQSATSLRKGDTFETELQNGKILRSKAVIVATGARWKTLGVPGEERLRNKGVAYCPHCDGPLFKGKAVAVIGGGNSGVEAALDLAGLAQHVTLLEFSPELKADQVLQNRLKDLPNIKVICNAQTQDILGERVVEGLRYVDRETNELKHLPVSGVFVQIGLVPNTGWLGGSLEKNAYGELITNARGATDIPGLFAAGDCTNSAFKQIVTSMGSGATAALSAFDWLLLNTSSEQSPVQAGPSGIDV